MRPIEGILALMDQAELEQEVDRISLPDHVAIEHAAGGISDAELFDQFLVMHATAVRYSRASVYRPSCC
jgi:hypothetical protein